MKATTQQTRKLILAFSLITLMLAKAQAQEASQVSQPQSLFARTCQVLSPSSETDCMKALVIEYRDINGCAQTEGQYQKRNQFVDKLIEIYKDVRSAYWQVNSEEQKTKVTRLSDDLYNFVSDLNRESISCNGDALVQAVNELEKNR